MIGTRILAVLTSVAAVAASCGGVARNLPAAVPEPSSSGAAAIAWEECGELRLECATFEAPVDHADPGGPTVPLSLVRLRVLNPEQRLGVLFYNPGGPGAPAVDMLDLVESPDSLWSRDLINRFDIIGMDPRGIGASAGVTCPEDAAPPFEPDPATLGPDRDAALAFYTDFAADCAAANDPALLAHMATDDVARDIDLIRAALGEEQISYYGASYGTFLGATYATLFPERVRRMVLDAPVDPTELDRLEVVVDQARSAESSLDDWFDLCEQEACPFGAGDRAAAFDALVTRLDAAPLQVPADGETPAQQVDGASVLAATGLVSAPGNWPVLTAALALAERGDGRILAEQSSGASGDDGQLHAVDCLDLSVPADLAEHDGNVDALVAAAPRVGDQYAYIGLPCLVWPATNPDRFTGPYTAAGAPPILVVGGREDTQTPYAWAEAMTAELDDAVLLTREGYGHGSYRMGAPCIDEAVDRYLVDGGLPRPGTTCPGQPVTTLVPR